jgi:PAS domain S-box-containing protein
MKKILAIDDQQDNLITIQAVLKNNIQDCRIFLAQSGEEGLELAEKEQPDTILLDIIMPRMDGYEVCKRLKSNTNTSHIPVVMITAIKTDAASRAKGLNMGADAFLAKPIEPVELSAQVNVMLRIKDAEDKLRAEKERLEFLVQERTLKLAESEKRYKALYYDAPLPYHSLTENGIFKEVNQSWLDLLGYSREEVIGKWFGDFLHPDYIPHFQNKFPEFKSSGFVQNVFFKIRHKNGHILDILLDGRMGYDVEGGVKQTFCVFQDVTEKNKIEQALKRSEERFRKAFQTSPDGININRVDDGKFVSINNGFTKNMGYAEEEIIGKTSMEINLWVDLSDRERFINQLLTMGRVENMEAKFRTKSGEIIDGLISASKIELNGVPHHINITRNVTERNKAARALAESERKLNTLLNNLQGIAYRSKFDKEWTMEFVSNGFETITGFSSDDILKNKKFSFNDLILPEDREKVFDTIQNAIHKKEGFELNYRIKTATGEVKYVLEKGVGIYDKTTGGVIALEGFISDITQQVIADKALKESEEKLRLIVNNSPVGISITDLEGKFIDVNPALSKIMGYSRSEMVTHHFNEFTHPGDKEINDEKFRKLVEGELAYYEIEKRYIHKNGHTIYVLIRSQLIYDLLGKPLFQTAMIEDITVRKKAEQIQRVLYQISNAVVNSVDLEKLIQLIRKELGTIIDTTNFFVALYDEETAAISLPFFVDEKDSYTSIPGGKSLTKYVIDTQKSLLANTEVKKKLVTEGKIEPLGSLSKVWMGVPLKTEGKITGVLAVQSYHDENAFTEADVKMLEFVSEQISISIQRVKAETELKAALQKANESDRLKSSFLATMSHELRTPLNAIIGFSEFFDKKLPPQEVEDFGKIIHTSGHHLLSIVNDLFDITLIESGETRLRNEDVMLKPILKDVYNVVDNIRDRESKHIVFKYVASEYDNELVIHTDPNKLKQILINLLKNAFKFTSEGYIRYGYHLTRENNTSFVRFFVQDSGIGISVDKQSVIFDLFRQVEDTSTRRYGGAGIGLSVAKRLTELLGGRIWLESEEGKGSTFYFTIPCGKGQIPAHQPTFEKEQPEVAKKAKVLIVEDDEAGFYYLKTVLERTGLEVLRASNGQEAVEMCLANSAINLVLMDINLPVMNGYLATQKIKLLFPEMPVIAQTAYAVSGDREKALEAGCDDYLAKPIQVKQLMGKINKYLNYSR